MNTYEFFNECFGRHLVNQSGAPHEAAWRALSASHNLAKGGKNRITSGWAIVRPGRSSLQQKLACPAFQYDDRQRFAAFADELARWDGSPRIFITFDKAPVPISNLFITYDLRAVRICSPGAVETFNHQAEPGKAAGQFHKLIWKQRRKTNA